MSKAGKRRIAAAGIGLAGLLAGVCHAAPPNDTWAGRTTIVALPFATNLPQVEQATGDDTDPVLSCVMFDPATRGANSVWYEYTTGDDSPYVDLAGAGYDTLVGVYEGSPDEGFAVARGGCNDNDDPTGAAGSRIVGLRLKSNTRYSIVVSRNPRRAAPAMPLSFSMQQSRVYAVTKTQDTDDGTCDADCSLREALAQSARAPGAVLVPRGTYTVTAELPARYGGSVYGAGMSETVIDASGTGRVLRHAEGDPATFALHDLTLTGGNTRYDGGAFLGGDGHYVFERVALRDNTAGGYGGGAAFALGTVSMFDSLVAGNRAANSGGGLSFRGWGIEIRESSIVGNESTATAAVSGGGGLYVRARNAVRLANTTVSGNRAAAEGAVYIGTYSPNFDVRINNSTIVDNVVGASADVARQGGLAFGPGIAPRRPVVDNTVVARNTVGGDTMRTFDCAQPAGLVITSNYNLVQAPNGCVFAAPGDRTGIDPQLLPLSTQLQLPVHVPAAGSPLIDAGDPGSSCERIDARGVMRPADDGSSPVPRCDIGAVERTSLNAEGIFADAFEPVPR